MEPGATSVQSAATSVESGTALEVPGEPRSAAVEHVAAPIEPVSDPVDKGSKFLVTPEVMSLSRGLEFSPTTPPHIDYSCTRPEM